MSQKFDLINDLSFKFNDIQNRTIIKKITKNKPKRNNLKAKVKAALGSRISLIRIKVFNIRRDGFGW